MYYQKLFPLTWLFLLLAIPLGTSSLILLFNVAVFLVAVFLIVLCKIWLWECRATTHTDLVVRAKQLGVDVKVVHNASVMNAVGICGLQLYRYGEAVSIPFFTGNWKPDSFYEKIRRNRELGLHTLCLLGEFFTFTYQLLAR